MGGKLRALTRTSLGTGGFTLVETLVTLVVVAVVGAALFQVLSASKVNVEEQKATLEAQQNARVALNSITEDFRHVSYGKDATQPSIAYANTDSVVFVADIFDSPGAEIISYFLSADGDADTPNPTDTILMKTVTDTTGAILVSAPQSYGIAAAGLQLRYFTGDNNELTVPVAQPETIGEIRVQVSGVSPRPMRNGNFHTVTLSSTIYPRNLPLTPARARPNPPQYSASWLPNCETITIAWVAPTSNTDGTPLVLNDISHFNFYITIDDGDRSLNARLNRTITQRSVPDLEAGHEYKIEVTAVSRAGVESYPMTRTVDLVSGLTPNAVADLEVTVSGLDAVLDWSNVTQFTDGSTIVTGVAYRIYQGDTPGFAPDSTNLVAQTPDWATTYTVSGLPDCGVTYFKLGTVACANESAPSAEVVAITPAPPSCAPTVHAEAGSLPTLVDVAWSLPTTRVDGTPLLPEDIGSVVVYYDTIPGVGPGSPSAVVSGAATSHTIVVAPCHSYYVNVAAVDECSTEGDLCAANEVSLVQGAPCTPGAPAAPEGLVQNAGDTNVQLTWNANTIDCDLAGYRIWYGHTPGGPYNGTGAVQGNSPIMVTADEVTSGSLASFMLTGLSSCASYYVAVSAYDVCEPFEESALSDEVTLDTTCQPCAISTTCTPVYSYGSTNTKVRLGLHATSEDEVVDAMKVVWSGGQHLSDVYFDGTRVWSADGAAGHDGSQSPVPSGTELAPWDFVITEASTAADGHEMILVFDADMRAEDLFIDFNSGGSCSVYGYVEPALVVDDFDDGNYNGWTVQTGNWAVDGGELAQTNEAGVFQWMHTSVLSHGGDFVFEADMNILSGGYGLMQFNRDASDSRHMTYVSAWSGEGHIGRFTTGYTDFGWGYYGFTNGEWYRCKVVREGSVYKLYANCNLVAEAAVFPDPPAGRLGFGAYYSSIRVDDVVIVEHDADASAAQN